MRHLLSGVEQRGKNHHVLVDDDRTIAAIGGTHQPELVALGGIGKRLLLVTWCDPLAVGYDPDLQKMHRLRLRMVEFAMTNTGARRHDLHVARPDHRPGADAVLVLERTFENVGDDLHVAVPVRTEALTGAHPVLVDHAQGSKAHLLWIVIVTE